MKKIVFILLTSGALLAGDDPEDSRIVPFSVLFYNLDQHLAESYSYNFGFNHLLAIGGTYGLVRSGADWHFRNYMADHKTIAYLGFPSVILGGLVPLTVPTGLYFYGKSHNDYQMQLTAMALGQAAILGWFISSAYKAVSGRKPPGILEDGQEKTDFSGDFNFGFMRRGIFDGWPSGHTTTAFAMAVTLIEMYPHSQKVKNYALLYATLIGLGVSTNIHWFSDAVAGALIGYAIGKAVGAGFRSRWEKEKSTDPLSLRFSPVGIQLRYTF